MASSGTRPRTARTRARPPAGARGFSIIEALVAAGILGIGLAGLVRLHTSAVSGIAQTDAVSLAVEVGLQRAELLSTMPVADVPACSGAIGCKAPGGGFRSELGAADGFACTRWVSNGDVPALGSGVSDEGSRYRVDTVVEAHPDATNQPNTRVLNVSVCWRDGGSVRELLIQRLLVPGV